MMELNSETLWRFFQVILLPLGAWFWKRQQSQKDEIKQVKEEKDELATQVAVLKTKIETLPTKESVHDLMLEMAEMKGALLAVDKQIDAVNASIKRGERVMDRVDKYLMGSKT